MAEKNTILSHIQDLEDSVINRYCSVKRRLERKMDWVDENTGFDLLEPAITDQILFYETRGYYLFQEPWLEHEPFKHRFRVVLTFRPTEANR